MSLKINENTSFLVTHRMFQANQQDFDRSLLRLSAGQRIVSSADDPAGLAISSKMRSQIASMVQATRNAEDAINLLKTAEGAAQVIDEKLVRMRQLAIESSNGTLTSQDRANLNTEFTALVSELDRISNVTDFNGMKLIDGTYSSGSGGIKFHIGISNVSEEDYYFTTIGDLSASGLGISGLSITDTGLAQGALTSIDNALNAKETSLADLGGSINRLTNTLENLDVSWENTSATESSLRDADMAVEMSNFVRSQMLSQTSVTMMAQANLMPQIVAGLLGG